MIYRFTVGRLSRAVISDGQMTQPWEPPLAAFFTPTAGVPEHELPYHMPFPGLGTIARQGDAYRWQPLRHDESQHGIWLLPEMPH
jgi:hypothetical protein